MNNIVIIVLNLIINKFKFSTIKVIIKSESVLSYNMIKDFSTSKIVNFVKSLVLHNPRQK